MRIFLLVLMMTLLPLRAGLGDVMAVERTRPSMPADMGPAAARDCQAEYPVVKCSASSAIAVPSAARRAGVGGSAGAVMVRRRR